MANKVVALILAGGKGTRLHSLTRKTPKPAVSFAAKYRIIDFPLSNCANSGINEVGVLTQYESGALDEYIGNGEKWGFDGARGICASLAPRQTEEGASWYMGTADAITQNIDFVDSRDADYILILSGDHIYKTTYDKMLDLHIKSGADATISVIEVPWEEAPRFGIMSTDKNGQIVEFQEKPSKPKSNLASMGIYIFTWKTLRKYLKEDAKNEKSEHDFGKDIIPTMLKRNKKLMAYRYEGYWKDVGTVSSLHEANMDIALNRPGTMDLYSKQNGWVYSEDTYSVPQYIGRHAKISNSIVNQGATILGSIDSCVVSTKALVEEETIVTRTVLMEGAVIKKGAKVNNAIISPYTVIEENAEINLNSDEIVLL